MPLPQPNPDCPVVVTGASSGIGEAISRELAKRGYSLILVARRRGRLEALASDLAQQHGVQTEVRVCDLIDREQRSALREEITDRDIAILCNNAGFVNFGSAAGSNQNRLREQVELNVVALHELTLALLARMRNRQSGGLLAVGSVAGHQPIPRMATYSASKAFVNNFYLALHQELQKDGIHCTVLAPGPVRTEITRAAGREELEELGPELMWISPERAAREAVEGLAANKRMVTPGAAAKVSKWAGQLTPRGLLLPAVEVATRRVEEAEDEKSAND